VYASQLNTWLDGIAAHKKTVFLSFPKSGGFAPVLEEDGTIVITACGATEGASRADDLAPGEPPVPFIENEILGGIAYNHGEINYHLTSSLTGKTPKGESLYAGISLATADANTDNYITIKEAWDWASDYESLTTEDPMLSDFGGIYSNTELTYPTLLHANVSQSESLQLRGLIGISKNVNIGINAGIEFLDNSKVSVLNNYVYLTLNAYGTLLIGDRCEFTGTGNFNFLEVAIDSDYTIGTHLTIKTSEPQNRWIIEIDDPLADISLDYASLSHAWITITCSNFELKNSNLKSVGLTQLYGIHTMNVNNTTFTDGYFRVLYGYPIIRNCQFAIGGFDQTMEATDLLSIEDCPEFTVSGCSFSNAYENGIWISNSGFGASGIQNGIHLISGDTITNCGQYSADAAGITVYNSHVDIRNNYEIAYNPIGIKSLNNSHVSITGNKLATAVNQTQQIHDNSINQVFATDGAFPYKIQYNAIYDDDNDCLIKYLPNPLGLQPHLDVRLNYWGANFDPNTDLCPEGAYTWNPVWNLQQQSPAPGNDESLFYASETLADSGQYNQAKAGYIQLVESYPYSEFAMAALKELFVLEAEVSDDYNSLKSYYNDIVTEQADEELAKIADFLANLCDIKLANYSSAITWYETVIQNPPTFADSLFAIIDLGNLYLHIENDSLKSSPTGSMAEYKPTSQKQYSTYRDYLLSLLFKDADETIESEEYTLLDDKTVSLLANTPNPFAGSTMLRYKLSEEAKIGIKIFDYAGRIVKSINQGSREAGQHSVALLAEDLSSGIYVCAIQIDGATMDTQKITVIK
jgi:tetratricopeptide (TPR) repeat protein